MTINGSFWTTHAEWTAQVGPRHLALGQEHRLEAGRCDEEAAKLERQGWRCGFSPAKRNALKTKTVSSLATSARTFVAAPKHWRLSGSGQRGAGRANGFRTKGGSPWHGFPSWEESQSSAFYFYHTEECQIREMRVLEDSGISPHHPVQRRLKCSFQGLVTRVQATPRALPSPIVVVRENLAAGTLISGRAWTNDGRSSCRALSKKSWEDATSWETKHEPTKSCAREVSQRLRTARDARWWRVLSNRLRELWLMEALQTRRPPD